MNRGINRIIILLIILPFIFCGCWDQRPFEEIGFATLEGIESSLDGNMNVTYTMPVFEQKTLSREEILDTSAPLLRAARNKLRGKSAKTIEVGKSEVILYSKELAEKGLIHNINEVFERDSSLPILALVAIVDGSPRELIHKSEQFKDKPSITTYMSQLLDRSIKSASTIETRVFKYDMNYFTPGIDNIVPLVKLTSNAVEVKGSALFSRGKMVGSINTKQNGLLMSMRSTLKNKQYTYISGGITDDTGNPKRGIAVLVRQNSKKIIISIKNNIPVVDIYLDLYGYIDEYKWDNLKDEKNVEKINEHIQGEIQADCKKLISYLQEINSDAIGIGDLVRAKHNSYWNTVKWHEAYKTAVITPHVKLNIIQYGAIQ